MNNRPSLTPASRKKTMWAWTVATFFGAGLLKPGPGTWGSVAAMLLWVAVVLPGMHGISAAGADFARGFYFEGTIVAALLATSLGIPAASRVARESGREDPGHVVIDEVAGQWLTLAACKPDWAHALLALVLFRLFDITKPWPIRRLEALPEGWGIMLDDLAAGLLGGLVRAIIQHWW